MTHRLRRERWGYRPERGVLSFEAKESTKESRRHGDYEDGPRRCAPWASACGSRTVGRPEFIRGVQFRPLGRNSLTTFRGQTALRGCPRARGVRCRIAPYRSLCSPPTLPAGRFGLRPRPHWGHAFLRDSSLRSPAGKKASIVHFDGGARNVARNLVSELPPSFVRAPVLAYFHRQNGQGFFPPLPIAALHPRSWREANYRGAGREAQFGMGVMWRSLCGR